MKWVTNNRERDYCHRFINEQQNYYDGHVLLLKEGATYSSYFIRENFCYPSRTSRVIPNIKVQAAGLPHPEFKSLLIEERKKVAYVWSELLIAAGRIDCCYAYWSTNAGCSVQRCVLHHLWEIHTRSPLGVVSPLSRGKSDEIFIANKTDRWLPVPKSRRRRRDIVGINPPVRIEILWNCGFCVHRFSQRPSLLNLCTYCMYILPHEII